MELNMNIEITSILLAFALSLIAGLSTGLGGCIGLFSKNTNTKFLSISLGFSAGVMIYVSMVEILSEANKYLNLSYGDKIGGLYTIFTFFGGMVLIMIINKLIPDEIDLKKDVYKTKGKLMRTGIFTSLVIAIHNFPEGIATFISSTESLKVGIPIVIAIAIHNIPEGISVSVPIYYATNNKEKAFLYSLMSGMAEPLGALICYLILMPFINDIIFGVLYGLVAGIMVFISFNELLPASREYGNKSLSIYGLIGGMLFMSLSLWLFI